MGGTQPSLFSLLELPLDQARPYLECDLCRFYSAGPLLYRCPVLDPDRCLHAHWTPDNIAWDLVHCAHVSCPLARPGPAHPRGLVGPARTTPCGGQLVPREHGWDYAPNPRRAEIIRACPQARPQVLVGGNVLAKYSHLARACAAIATPRLGRWVTLEEIAARHHEDGQQSGGVVCTADIAAP